jgi:hypothetical protein
MNSPAPPLGRPLVASQEDCRPWRHVHEPLLLNAEGWSTSLGFKRPTVSRSRGTSGLRKALGPPPSPGLTSGHLVDADLPAIR